MAKLLLHALETVVKPINFIGEKFLYLLYWQYNLS